MELLKLFIKRITLHIKKKNSELRKKYDLIEQYIKIENQKLYEKQQILNKLSKKIKYRYMRNYTKIY